uniref:Uncharacterized protein n=1 Tax=Aegilops tauschii subsp. strangulata TaxID=200361 RepID=A0A453CQS2_AEGTS
MLLSARHVLLITRLRTANTRQSYDDLHQLLVYSFFLS